MLLALRGEDVTISESAPVEPPKEQADFSEFNTEDITFTYCTEFIVSRETSRDPGGSCGSSKSWATVWFWWTTMRSSRSTFTPIIPAPRSRKP